MLSLALLAVTLAVQPGPPQAPAPPPAARADAYQAFLEARRLESAGDAPGAIAALEKAATLDVSPGILTELAQLYARPIASLHPYRTPIDGVFLCSSSTPPGVGVHGMCGFHAARAALSFLRKN